MKKERKYFYVFAGCAIILVLAWLLLSDRTRTYTGKLVSEERGDIVQEVPFLELTQEELEMYEVLREDSGNGDLWKQEESVKVLPEDMTQKLAGHLIPSEAENGKLQIEASTVNLYYSMLNVDVIISYPMIESGEVIKIISLFEGETSTLCKFQYVNYNNQRYEKYKTVRVWFPWMKSE